MNISVVYSLPTMRVKQTEFGECEADTEMSAGLIRDALARLGHKVQLTPVSETTIDNMKQIKTDLIFNVVEWTGIDLPLADRVNTLLFQLGIPVTGASPQNYLITTDKITMKQAFNTYKLETASWQVFYDGNELVNPLLPYPLIVKLSREHSGVGLYPDSKVETKNDLVKIVKKRIADFHQPVIAEEYIEGREFEVGILVVDNKTVVFPAAENLYTADSPVKFLTYDGRWQDNHERFAKYTVQVAQFTKKEQSDLENLCLKTFKSLKFTGYARFDIRQRKNGTFVLIETNSNPGIDDHKDNGLAVGFHAIGMNFDMFINAIVLDALTRWKSK